MNRPRISKSDLLDRQHGPPKRLYAEGTTGDRAEMDRRREKRFPSPGIHREENCYQLSTGWADGLAVRDQPSFPVRNVRKHDTQHSAKAHGRLPARASCAPPHLSRRTPATAHLADLLGSGYCPTLTAMNTINSFPYAFNTSRTPFLADLPIGNPLARTYSAKRQPELGAVAGSAVAYESGHQVILAATPTRSGLSGTLENAFLLSFHARKPDWSFPDCRICVVFWQLFGS